MKLFIPRDIFDNPRPPRLFLCTTGKKIIGELPSYEVSLDAKWGAYAELSFSIDRQYVDMITGDTKVHPLFDKAEGLRKVYVENIGYFVIQDPDANYNDKDSKTLSSFSSEYETGSKYLESFRINTGDVDSAEVTYLAGKYGENYTIDTPYEVAHGVFDAYESYYIKEYSNASLYTYQQVEIRTSSEYETYDGSTVEKTLYIKKYPNVRFYWPTKPELSLVHLILKKIPEWKVEDVDVDISLWRKERKFDQDRIAVYDFLMNEVADTFKCAVEWDTITNHIHFYEEAEDGVTNDNTIQTRWDTDVFISRENLANEIDISYSTDDIKTKLKVSGADNLDIREINLGKNYIMNLSFYHTVDWMEPDLFEAYQDYLDAVELYSPDYTAAMNGWISSYNKWNDFMNAVPAEGNVVLVGDVFKKLYCVHVPQYEEGATDELIESATNAAITALSEKLKIYQVIDDTEGNKPDNILLRLKNINSDIATIRVYNSGTNTTPEYTIKSVVVRASSGLEDTPQEYTLRQWVTGQLTDSFMRLEEYTVNYIGTMGAYFVLAKDESVKANLEDYGVNLLKEKHKVYTTIFQTQTEEMYSQEKYQCVASNDEPNGGNVQEGTRWLDTDNIPLKLYRRTNAPASAAFEDKWIITDADNKLVQTNSADLENYQRYIDNYEKLQAVQEVLLKKEREAEYLLNGYVVPNRKIVLTDGSSLEENMERIAQAHFNGYTITRKSIDPTLPLYKFTTSFDSIVYGKNSKAYNPFEQYYTKDNTMDVYTPVEIADQKTFDEYDGKTNDKTLYVVTSGHTFAVYLKGATPYVAYDDSQGVYQAQMNRLSELTDFEKFFSLDQWVRLSPFIREDEFVDDNFLLTGYESEEERLKICKDLFDSANKELDTLCRPSLEFSMTMANILALPEFNSLIDQFQLGNFVRVHIRDGYVKRARLLEVHLNFDDLSDFNCDFGNLITTKSEIDKHAELLSQAVTAGKQVATSAGDWQKAVDKSNKFEEELAAGLQNTAIQVGRASGQAITWDEHGFYCRKLQDGSDNTYMDEQIAIINNKIVFTNDGWKTSKAALGEFEVDVNGDGVSEKMYGLIADAVVSGFIKGSVIEGGSLKIGGQTGDQGTFIVNEDGSVQILGPNNDDLYASAGDVNILSKALKYQTELVYESSTIFAKPNSSCIIACKVYKQNETTGEYEEITSQLEGKATFTWIRNPSPWTPQAENPYPAFNKIKIVNGDIEKNAQFSCQVQFDTEQI